MLLVLVFSIWYISLFIQFLFVLPKIQGEGKCLPPTLAVTPNVRAKFLLRWISWQTRDTCNLSPHTTLWNSIQAIHWYLWRHAIRLSFSFMAFRDTMQIKYKFTHGRRVLTGYSRNLTPAVHLIRTCLLIKLKFGDGLVKRATTLEFMP
jgi:hypothetical protein